MKFLLLSVLSLSTVVGFAQQSPSLKSARENRLNNLSLNKPIDNMPMANVGPTGQTFLNNNGNGLDIYKSQPDNMPVAKPDSSYFYTMIVKTMDAKKIVDSINHYQINQFRPCGNCISQSKLPIKKDSTDFQKSIKKLELKPKF
jgi:hypothetical protein